MVTTRAVSTEPDRGGGGRRPSFPSGPTALLRRMPRATGLDCACCAEERRSRCGLGLWARSLGSRVVPSHGSLRTRTANFGSTESAIHTQLLVGTGARCRAVSERLKGGPSHRLPVVKPRVGRSLCIEILGTTRLLSSRADYLPISCSCLIHPQKGLFLYMIRTGMDSKQMAYGTRRCTHRPRPETVWPGCDYSPNTSRSRVPH